MSRSQLLACALLVLVLTAHPAAAAEKKVPKACKKFFKEYSEIDAFTGEVRSVCPINLITLTLESCTDDCRDTIRRVSLGCVKAAGKPYGKAIVKALVKGYKKCK